MIDSKVIVAMLEYSGLGFCFLVTASENNNCLVALLPGIEAKTKVCALYAGSGLCQWAHCTFRLVCPEASGDAGVDSSVDWLECL